MEKNSFKTNKIFAAEEEKILNWTEIQNAFEKNFGEEIYNSWLKNISLEKEFHDHLILGVPTRFFRDWIVSRYLDKILSELKKFKISIITHQGSYYCLKCKKIVLKEDCKKDCKFLNISGTEFRKKIILKKPFKFARPELNKYLKNFKGKIFYND